MTDVVERDRVVVPPPTRLNRVRCLHCHMPAGGTHPTCWSCGLDPTGPLETDLVARPVPAGNGNLPGPWHTVLLASAAVTLVLVALLGTILMLDPRDGGLRGIAARVNGQPWLRADVGGATAEFPSRPVRSTVEMGAGTPGTADALVATAPGVRVELRAAPIDVRLSPAALIDAYAAATGHQVKESAPAAVPGASALDALLDGPDGSLRVRAVLTGLAAYLLAVDGPAAAFERFVESFVPAS